MVRMLFLVKREGKPHLSTKENNIWFKIRILVLDDFLHRENSLFVSQIHANSFWYVLGNYTCICSIGYEGSGYQCDNVDECSLGTHLCPEEASCSDTDGNYTCTCKTGYQGNGFSCANVDECILNTHSCHANANCTDTIGLLAWFSQDKLT